MRQLQQIYMWQLQQIYMWLPLIVVRKLTGKISTSLSQKIWQLQFKNDRKVIERFSSTLGTWCLADFPLLLLCCGQILDYLVHNTLGMQSSDADSIFTVDLPSKEQFSLSQLCCCLQPLLTVCSNAVHKASFLALSSTTPLIYYICSIPPAVITHPTKFRLLALACQGSTTQLCLNQQHALTQPLPAGQRILNKPLIPSLPQYHSITQH